MYQIIFYVPEDHLETVKQSLFDLGVGQLGDYAECCWQTLGRGQFRPLASSKPFLGEHDELSQLAEYKVEILCADSLIKKAIQQLVLAHPYEEPAYAVFKLEDMSE